MRVAVECTWISVGAVELGAGELRMPALPDEPGIYRWVFRHDERERWYVGEADRLRRRFHHYRKPGPSQSTNLRMRDRALRVLTAGGSIELQLAKDVTFVVNGESHAADLTSKHARCLVENAALIELLGTVGELVNDKGYGLLREHPILR